MEPKHDPEQNLGIFDPDTLVIQLNWSIVAANGICIWRIGFTNWTCRWRVTGFVGGAQFNSAFERQAGSTSSHNLKRFILKAAYLCCDWVNQFCRLERLRITAIFDNA